MYTAAGIIQHGIHANETGGEHDHELDCQEAAGVENQDVFEIGAGILRSFQRIPEKGGNGRDETFRSGRGGDAFALPAIDDVGFGSKIARDGEDRQAAG